MRKQRPTPTGTGRKGRKLKGLTTQEAHLRSIKGWHTRRARGWKGALRASKVHRPLAQEKWDPDFWQGDLEPDSPIGREGLAARRRAEADLTQERLDWEAKHFQSKGSFSKDFEDVLAGVPKEHREELLARVRVQRNLESRLTRIERGLDDSMLEPGNDAGAMARKQAMNRVSSLINQDATHDPRRTGHGYMNQFLEDSDFSHHEMALGGSGQRDERLRVKGLERVPVTENQIRKRAQKEISNSFDLKDPITGNVRTTAHPNQRKALEEYIVRSHFATTEPERASARRSAERLSQKMSQKAGSIQGNRQEAAQIAEVDRGITRKAQKTLEVYDYYPTGEIGAQEAITYPRGRGRSGIEAELADLQKKSPQIQKLAARETQLKAREVHLRKTGGAEPAKYTYDKNGNPRLAKRATKPLESGRINSELNQIALERAGIRAELDNYHGLVNRYKSIVWETPQERASRITGAGFNPFTNRKIEQRLKDTRTAEDLYDQFGAEQSGLKGIKGSLRMHKVLAEDKAKAMRDGTFTAGWDTAGNAVRPEQAAWRIGPNAQWTYRLIGEEGKPQRERYNPDTKRFEPDSSIRQDLPYWDKNTKHVQGRMRNGQIMPEYPDEVISERLTQKHKHAFEVSRGAAQRESGKRELLPHQASETIIPLRGVKTSTRKVKAFDETFPVKTISVPYRGHTAGNRWVEATDAEYAAADPARRRIERMQASHLHTYMDPSLIEYRGRHNVAISAKGRTLDVDLAQVSPRTSRVFHSVADAKNERMLREASDEAGWKAKHEGGPIPDENNRAMKKGSLKEIAAAGGYAAYYGSKKRFREGTGRRMVNRTYEGMYSNTPKFRKWADKHGYKPDDVLTAATDHAPGIAHVANLGRSVLHPLMSESGASLGIEWGPLWRREGKLGKFVPWSDETVAKRDVLRQRDRVERVVNTQEFVSKNAYRSGLAGKLGRHRAVPLKNWQEYQNFYNREGLLDQSLVGARHIMSTHDSGSDAFKEAAHLAARVTELRAKNSARTEGFGTDIVRYSKPARRSLSSNTQRNLVIGGAVVGAALGAHYLYHRHEEKKRHEADANYAGTRYYNKAIPGPVSVPTIKGRATGHYHIHDNVVTREFMLAGNKLPVQWSFKPARKTIWQGSPEDRGYDPSLPLLGRGSKVRKPTKGGSLQESLFFDQAATGTRRKSFQPTGQQLVIRGRKLPIRAEIGKRKEINLSATNPTRLSQTDRENLVWAFQGHADAAELRRFYAHDPRLQDLMNNPGSVSRIKKTKGIGLDDRVAPSVFFRDVEGGTVPVKSKTRKDKVLRHAGNYSDKASETELSTDQIQEERDAYLARSHEPGFRATRGAQMSTGGTMGMDTYSQIGHTHTKIEEAFDAGSQPVKRTRTRQPYNDEGKPIGKPKTETYWEPPKPKRTSRGVGSRRRNTDQLGYDFPYNPKKPPGRKKK